MVAEVTSQSTNVVDSSSLNAISFNYDTTFEKIVEAITPNVIKEDNKELIESFVSLLSDISPISINIVDAFHHQDAAETSHDNHIKGVQDGFNEMYLNDWFSTYQAASNNYVLRNRLNTILEQYKVLESGSENMDATLSFFNDPDEFFRTERYVLGRNFKQKKGTPTAIEYAYKTAWMANIEGPFKTAYDFTLNRSECVGGLTEGFHICNSLTTACSFPGYVGGVYGDGSSGIIYPPEPASSGVGALIDSFIISEEVTSAECTPFSYEVDAGMLPIMYEAFVVPLAHPVGFKYKYRKLLGEDFVDYFNIEFIYSADKISVLSLCPEGDCTRAEEIIYSSSLPDVSSISGSHFNKYETGNLVTGPWKGYSFEKYIMANGSYLISYSIVIDGALQREILYYDIDELYINNSVINGDFEFDLTLWNPSSNKWSIVDQSAKLVDGSEEDFISQSLALVEGDYYKIQFDIVVDNNTTEGKVYIGSIAEDINGDIILDEDAFEFTFDQSISYELDYQARGSGLDNIVFKGAYPVSNPDVSTFSVDNIRVTRYMPKDRYINAEHAAIIVDNPATPEPILYTNDTFDMNISTSWSKHLRDGDVDSRADYMAELFFQTTNLEAIIGEIYISDSRINISQQDTAQGGFIIGGNIIPFGDVETSYMFDDLDFSQVYYDEGDIIPTRWNETIPYSFEDVNGWATGNVWHIDQSSVDNILVKDVATSAATATYTSSIPADSKYIQVDFRINNEINDEGDDSVYINLGWDGDIVDSYIYTKEPYDFYTTELTFNEVYILGGNVVKLVYWDDEISTNIDYFQARTTLGDVNLSTENFKDEIRWIQMEFAKYITTGSEQIVNIEVDDIVEYEIDGTGDNANGVVGKNYKSLVSKNIDLNNTLFERVWTQAVDYEYDTQSINFRVGQVTIIVGDIVYYNVDNDISGGTVGNYYTSLENKDIDLRTEDFTTVSWTDNGNTPPGNISYSIEETKSQEVYMRVGDAVLYNGSSNSSGVIGDIYITKSIAARTEDLNTIDFSATEDYTTTGASQIVSISIGDIVLYDVESSVGSGTIGRYYRSEVSGSFDLDTIEYDTSSNWISISTFTPLIPDYITTGVSQDVSIQPGDVVKYAVDGTGIDAGGTIGTYYKSSRVYSSIDLNEINYDIIPEWEEVSVEPNLPSVDFSTDNGTRFVRLHKDDIVLHRGETFKNLTGVEAPLFVVPTDINKEIYPSNPTDLVDTTEPISNINPSINDNWVWIDLPITTNTYPTEHTDARYSKSGMYSVMIPNTGNTEPELKLIASQNFIGSINNVKVTYLRGI